MLRLTLVTVVVYIANRLESVAVEVNPQQNPARATCHLGHPTAVVALVTYGAIPIVCPEGSSLRQSYHKEPVGATRPVFSTDDLRARPVILDQVAPGTTFEMGPEFPTVVVVQLPSTSQSLFFLCQADEGEAKYCFVRVDIPASPLLGPNACAVPNTEVQFTVKTSRSIVQFACGDTGTLHPQNPEKVLDHTCTQELDLHTEVRDAVCERRLDKSMVTVSFPNLPLTRKKLCYRCVDENNRRNPGTECRVFINVAEGEEEEATSADVAEGEKDEVTSAAVSITTRSASALAITVAAGFFLL